MLAPARSGGRVSLPKVGRRGPAPREVDPRLKLRTWPLVSWRATPLFWAPLCRNKIPTSYYRPNPHRERAGNSDGAFFERGASSVDTRESFQVAMMPSAERGLRLTILQFCLPLF